MARCGDPAPAASLCESLHACRPAAFAGAWEVLSACGLLIAVTWKLQRPRPSPGGVSQGHKNQREHASSGWPSVSWEPLLRASSQEVSRGRACSFWAGTNFFLGKFRVPEPGLPGRSEVRVGVDRPHWRPERVWLGLDAARGRAAACELRSLAKEGAGQDRGSGSI